MYNGGGSTPDASVYRAAEPYPRAIEPSMPPAPAAYRSRHGMDPLPTPPLAKPAIGVFTKPPVVGSHSAYHHSSSEQHGSDSRKASSSMSQSSFDSSKRDANGKPKLPHGLTVHELKEMTKARLQAEAAEKQPPSSVPSMVSVMPEPHSMTRSQASPLPPGFRMNSNSPYPDTMDHPNNRFESWQESRGDAWETTSVSTAASDYLLPDSFSSVGGGDDYSFGRPRPYQTNGPRDMPSHESMQMSALPMNGASNSSSSYYDGYPQNRRRAATLSPRPGLMHLHEDRPVLSGEGGPGIPYFSSCRLLPVRNRVAYNNNGSNMSNDASYGRQRTSSTTSLPAISHTAEEFGDATPSLFSSQFSGSVREDEGLAVTGLVDVFRGSPTSFNGMTSPPPGMGESDRLYVSRTNTSSSGGFGGSFGNGDERARAATWSGHTSDLFGPGLFGDNRNNDDQDALASDLASILKLSGAKEESDGLFYCPPGL